MQNTENVYAKIKKRSVYKDHIPKKALVPKTGVHVKIGSNSNPSLYDAYAILIYNIALLLALAALKYASRLQNQYRTRRTENWVVFSRPRVSFNILNNKEDQEGEKRLMSLSGTRECLLGCYTCAKDHNNDNPRCPISAFEKV